MNTTNNKINQGIAHKYILPWLLCNQKITQNVVWWYAQYGLSYIKDRMFCSVSKSEVSYSFRYCFQCHINSYMIVQLCGLGVIRDTLNDMRVMKELTAIDREIWENLAETIVSKKEKLLIQSFTTSDSDAAQHIVTVRCHLNHIIHSCSFPLE